MDIEIKGLRKSFHGETVFSGLDICFKENEVTCIMAPSGFGKTTFLNILMDFERADAGEITGVPEHISAVFQEDRLCEGFSALCNIRIAAAKEYDDKKITGLLESLGLDESDAFKPVSQMSGGMKRRVALARALAADSQLLIMDEPFKGLDEETKKKAAAAVVSAGKTTIVVTHDEMDARLLGARIILL